MEIGSQGLEDCESARGGFERGEDLWRKLAHAACAEGQDHIAVLRVCSHDADSSRELRRKFNAWTLNALGEPLGSYAGDRLFACRVDGQDDHCISVSERTAELLQ